MELLSVSMSSGQEIQVGLVFPIKVLKPLFMSLSILKFENFYISSINKKTKHKYSHSPATTKASNLFIYFGHTKIKMKNQIFQKMEKNIYKLGEKKLQIYHSNFLHGLQMTTKHGSKALGLSK